MSPDTACSICSPDTLSCFASAVAVTCRLWHTSARILSTEDSADPGRRRTGTSGEPRDPILTRRGASRPRPGREPSAAIESRIPPSLEVSFGVACTRVMCQVGDAEGALRRRASRPRPGREPSAAIESRIPPSLEVSFGVACTRVMCRVGAGGPPERPLNVVKKYDTGTTGVDAIGQVRVLF